MAVSEDDVAPLSALAEGEARAFEVNGEGIVLCRYEGEPGLWATAWPVVWTTGLGCSLCWPGLSGHRKPLVTRGASGRVSASKR